MKHLLEKDFVNVFGLACLPAGNFNEFFDAALHTTLDMVQEPYSQGPYSQSNLCFEGILIGDFFEI